MWVEKVVCFWEKLVYGIDIINANYINYQRNNKSGRKNKLFSNILTYSKIFKMVIIMKIVIFQLF